VNEPFDVEISRALKESADKSLSGWEFTPAMRAKVLERVRAEAAEAPAPTEPARRKQLDPAKLIRPVTWVAVAAAAAFMVVSVGPMGSMKKASDGMRMEAAQDAAPEAATMMAVPTGDDMKAKGVAPPTAQRSAAQMVSLSLPTAPAITPESVQPPTLAGPKMAAAAFTMNVAADVALSNAVVLNTTGVQAVDPNGAVLWNRTMEGLDQQSVLAVSHDGRVALGGANNQMRILNAAGDTEQVVYATAPIHRMVWSNDGRVAAVEGSMVFVYNAANGKQEYHVDAGAAQEVGFSPDGRLAVFGRGTDGRPVLTLRDAMGGRLWETSPAVDGQGLVFTAGGKVVVAAGQAYSLDGVALWSMPFTPLGLSALTDSTLVAWDDRSVVLLEGEGGNLLWQAGFEGAGRLLTVAAAPDGRYLAIAAETGHGPVVWLVTAGGQQVSAEFVAAAPVDLSFSGNRLLIVLPQSVTAKVLP